jgi:DNA-binding IclR family transcriptional regulator
VNFTQILKDLNIPRSSAHGLLKTLISSGWLGQDPDSKEYSLGLRAWQVGQLYRGHYHLVGIAKPIMDRLASTVGETVQLARLDGIENVYIAISESDREMRLSSRVGGRLLAHATGIGKALLSMKDPVEVEALLRSNHLPQYTRKTVTDVDQLMKLIGSVNKVGFSIDDEEYVSGCRCVAVPLMKDLNGQSLTALSITMPTSRTDKNWPLSIVEPLKLAAEEIRSIVGTTEGK